LPCLFGTPIQARLASLLAQMGLFWRAYAIQYKKETVQSPLGGLRLMLSRTPPPARTTFSRRDQWTEGAVVLCVLVRTIQQQVGELNLRPENKGTSSGLSLRLGLAVSFWHAHSSAAGFPPSSSDLVLAGLCHPFLKDTRYFSTALNTLSS